jgi:hypothetical protein
MVNFIGRIIPDLFCLYLALWGVRFEEKIAVQRIREYLGGLRSRPGGTVGMVSEEGLLQLYKLLKGSIASFIGMAVAASSALFSLIVLDGNWGAIIGIPIFLSSVTMMSTMWMGTSLDTVERSIWLQRAIFLVILTLSLGLKIYEAIGLIQVNSGAPH